MTRICRRILCFALVLMMGAALLPDLFAGSAKAESTLGIVTKDDVNVRQAPSMKGKLYCKAKKNTVVEVRGTTTAEGYTWYEILIQDLENKYQPWYDGYIRGDCFRMLTDEEAAKYTAGNVVPAGNGSSVVTAPPSSEGNPSAVVTAPPATRDANVPEGTVGVINDWGVNFRAKPSGAIIKSLDKGTQVNVLSIPSSISRSTWYRVEYQGSVGYIMSVYLTVTGVDPSITTAPDVTPTATAANTNTPTPAPTTNVDSDALGYVQTTKGSVNIRASIGGTVITTVGRYQTFPYLLAPVKRGNYTWYFIRVNKNIQGYVRGDCVKVVKKPVITPTPAPVITPTADPSQPTPTPTPTPTPAPQPDEPTGYLKTTLSDVNVRKGVAGDTFTVVKKKGTQFPYYGEPTVSGKYKWYKIYDASFSTKDHFGYIRGDCIALVDPSGNTPTPVPETPTPEPTATPTPSPTPGGKNEAEYVTLRPGSSGTAVSMLVAELKNQGYFTGDVTSKYNSKVENAVRAFQQAKGLAVDGIAGSNTQHALFNTVPVGTADRTNLTMTIYPAEVIDWFTGGIQELWPRGSNFKVYDVQTGIVFWAHRWAGGLHADIEPLTAADTQRICDMYGVSKSSEITEKKHWQRRPCLVTIGTRTFACSLFGVPHNYPDGDTIADNDFKGQMCLHFTNSKVHESKKVDKGHQQAIHDAWMNAPNGHIGTEPVVNGQ